ncbi:MAG: right-handed parallel beta-helix repeat-containing protein [Planctomycetota bacterium]|nr:right-handed parallel beta-helix repeat-containing protein [Planctomycetota bacterium]MDA1214781.1 right-handed parallel beta-helix repeat-containing protein [Planctomycetota bacterium]
MSNIYDFGAVGDGVADDTDAFEHALQTGDGLVDIPRGDYRLTRTLVVDLAKHGRRAIHGQEGLAKLIVAHAGPALVIKGTHAGSADPASFKPEIWQNERMPTLSGFEIQGDHPEADGIEVVGAVQATLTGLLIRQVRTGVHVTQRARNLIISHCHIYHNTCIGVHLDQLNLHQAIINNSHISYCRLGGIRVEKSEIRNFQICGNDIEYNNNRAHGIEGADAEPTAEIYIDVREGSVREGTIVGNTIQATASPNGANVRFIGDTVVNQKGGMWTISGNLIGSQTDNVHLTGCRGITLTGNFIYSGHHRNLLVENSREIVVGSNCFGHNPDYGTKELCTGMRFVDAENCTLSGNVIQDSDTSQHTVANVVPVERSGLLEFVRCRRMTITGLQIVNPAPYGIDLEDCSDILINGCSILDAREKPLMEAALRWQGAGTGNMVHSCRFSKGTAGELLVSEDGIDLANNVMG